jgi:hypothetical protein
MKKLKNQNETRTCSKHRAQRQAHRASALTARLLLCHVRDRRPCSIWVPMQTSVDFLLHDSDCAITNTQTLARDLNAHFKLWTGRPVMRARAHSQF